MPADAVWDARFRRTGFYEIISRGDGFRYQRPIPVYLLNLVGFGGGPMIEPGDCFGDRTQEGIGSAASSSLYGWKKADEIVELGSRLNAILEDHPVGEDPQPLHSIGFGWPGI